ncbi:hypothetical protein CANARDRAFT_202240 [[Candida] arabinofermentans NRRL YB-2248]|uniref:Mediator of RNA polymerase II transcription subunit 4 n=1 Tax=[Candida] arabinofermentans NRRL YB-2248 TaxID=983967 RepID=A0A1E4SWC7_9ASCO|nr:hypothetical protein CANARDRAFT_202240 [[Candida] arabinofermentans NRRL YB-2248]
MLSNFNASTPGQVGAPPTSAVPGSVKTYKNENTFIYQELLRFESGLQKLSASIQQYEPNPEIASALVSSMDSINNELNQLEILHDLKMNQVLKQNSENMQLNDNLRNILVSLDECRKELNELPKLSIEEEIELKKNKKNIELDEDSVAEIPKPDLEATKTLLTYAMKLAKFSKIPRTFDGYLMPNNFIWPGDDNMRRGMLATASMMPEKIIENENGTSDMNEDTTMNEASAVNNEQEDADDDEEDDELLPERRNENAGLYKADESDKTEKKDAATIMADLDLFDDESDYDE